MQHFVSRILFRADVTSHGTLLLYKKGSIKGVVWQLPLVLPCQGPAPGVSCKDDSTGMEPATQIPTGDFEGSLDHVMVSGTRYRVYIPPDETSGNSWLQTLPSANYELRNFLCCQGV